MATEKADNLAATVRNVARPLYVPSSISLNEKRAHRVLGPIPLVAY